MAPPAPKPGSEGTQVEQRQENSTGKTAAQRRAILMRYILRVGAVKVTLAAAITMGVTKQTQEFELNGDLVQGTLKAIDGSAFKFFVVANAVACAYGILAVALSIVNRGRSRKLALVLSLLDLMMVALLFSGNGTASAIGVVAKRGEGVLWEKICNVFDKFCSGVTASIVLSMSGALSYLQLVMSALHGTQSTAQ